MPTRLPGRSYTTYDVYGDYNSDDLLNEMYPIDGVYTPQPAVDSTYAPQTPLNGLQRNGRATPGRSKSRLRSPNRPQSRYDVGVQSKEVPEKTEKKVRPLPSETQYNYSIPDQMARPTSPVQRLLERGNTQPYMNLQGSLPGSEMDPITRQYYHRMWKTQGPHTDMNLNRYGRAGGVWRHVRACVANTGTQLAFIDGTVKEEDNVYFPPWHKSNRPASYTNYQPASLSANFIPQTRTVLPPKSARLRNQFNTRAKEGYKYWYQEPKPIDLRGATTRLRARIVGNGY